jgi:pimeloyl-ACP methyl ester carboxylesterase
MLLHPVGLDHGCWQFTGLDAVTPDYPGHGGRDFPGEQYSLEYIADEIAGAYQGAFDVVGLSMGSHVAQYLAVRHPQQVRSLMLCCASLGGTRASAAAVTSDSRAEDTLRLGMKGTLDTTLQRWFTPELLAQPDHPALRYTRERLLSDDPEVVAASWLALRRSSVADQLAGITVPTTVFGGRSDLAAPPERILKLFGAVPASRLEIIDGPHMIQLERPADFAAAVRRHLEWVGLTLGGRARR